MLLSSYVGMSIYMNMIDMITQQHMAIYGCDLEREAKPDVLLASGSGSLKLSMFQKRAGGNKS